MSVSPTAGHEPENPRIIEANFSVGVRLFASAVAFVFVAFVFAFFYLKAVNSNGLWRPSHTSPEQGFGIAILVCVLGTTALFDVARRDVAGGAGWRTSGAIALALSIAAFVLQIVDWTSTSFSATAGGYASVFYGWTVMWLVFWVGAVYWIETLLAETIRGGSALEPLRPTAAACIVYLYLMAAVELIAWVLLYLIK